MTHEELFIRKRRLLIGAAAAKRIALAPDRFLFFDQEAYLETLRCLAAMPEDLADLLAELDVLRAASGESIVFPWDQQREESGNGDANNGGEPVAESKGDASRGGGETAPDDSAGTGRAVQDVRPPRRRGRRPKPKADQGSSSGDPPTVAAGS